MADIMVTGGAGFIGSALVRRLRSEGQSICILDAMTYAACRENLADVVDGAACILVEGSIEDRPLVRSLLRRHRPEIVINAAAESHVDRSIDSPDRFFATNVMGTVALLEECLQYRRELPADPHTRFRFVQVSTDEVYGSLASGAADEEAALRPNSPYSASKAGGDMAARAFHRTYDLPIMITRGSNTFGPRQFPEKLIPRMILSALAGQDLPVYGDGLHERDWLHVDDHVGGIIAAARSGRAGEIYNFGASAGISNLRLVEGLCDVLQAVHPSTEVGGYRGRIVFTADRPGHDRRYALNCAKAGSTLGWRQTVQLREGLESTVAWYLANRDWWESIVAGRYRLERLGLVESGST